MNLVTIVGLYRHLYIKSKELKSKVPLYRMGDSWLMQPEVCLPPPHEPGRAGPAALVQFTAAPLHNCPVAISGRYQTFSFCMTHYRC